MSATAGSIQTDAIETALGLVLNNFDIELQSIKKLTGDVTLTITPAQLNFVNGVYFFFGAGGDSFAQSTAPVAAIDNTQGAQAIACTSLPTGSDTLAGLAILYGTRR